MGPRGEPTPPSSLHPDRHSPTNIPNYAPPATPPQNHGEVPASDQKHAGEIQGANNLASWEYATVPRNQV